MKNNEFSGHFVYHAARLKRCTGSARTSLGPIVQIFPNSPPPQKNVNVPQTNAPNESKNIIPLTPMGSSLTGHSAHIKVTGIFLAHVSAISPIGIYRSSKGEGGLAKYFFGVESSYFCYLGLHATFYPANYIILLGEWRVAK
jgi:hypothetical protein